MIFVVEKPPAAPAHAWFAYDEQDLLAKLAADGALEGWQAHASETLEDLVEAAIGRRAECRIHWDEAEAMAAFERTADPYWAGEGWRARWALREQLIALEVLADDN